MSVPNVLANRYASAAMRTVWSPENKIIAERRLWIAVLTAQRDLGVDFGGDDPDAVIAAYTAQVERVDPTGVGDGFRAGFLSGLAWGLGHERCAQIGSTLASYVLETVGTQEYVVTREGFLERFGEAYGQVAADEIAPLVRTMRG